MKKFLPALVLLSLLIAPAILAANDQCTISDGNLDRLHALSSSTAGCVSPCLFATNDVCGMCCVLNTVYNITDWIFVFLVVIVAIFVLIGAFNFITSAGDPEKTKSGRNYILYAAIGLAVAFLAKAVPGLIRVITGLN